MMKYGRYALAALAIGGVTAGTALVGMGSAAADSPLDGPLLNSTCSFAQVDRALHATHPDLAAKLDAHPDRKTKMQQLFDQPAAQRKAAIEQLSAQHPDKVNQMKQRAAQHPDKVNQAKNVMNQLAQTCHQY